MQDDIQRAFELLHDLSPGQLVIIEAERQQAISQMKLVGGNTDDHALETLLGYMRQTANRLLRPLAAIRLMEINDRRIVPELIKMAEDYDADDRDLRLLAVQVLGDLQAETAFTTFVYGLQHETDGEVQARCAWALGKLGNEQAIFVLANAMRQSKDRRLRHYAIEAIGRLGDESLSPLMARIAQKHPDKETRTYAIEALGRFGGSEAVKTLINLLQDTTQSYLVRSEAAAALGEAGDRKAIPVLQQVSPDEHEWIVHHVRQSIAKLSL